MSAQSTPRHLWIDGVVTLLWNAMGALDYVMSQTRNEQYMAAFTPEQLEYFYSFPSWAVATWATAVWGSVLGSILLLARSRFAYPVFVVSFAAMFLTTIYNFVLTNGFEIMGGIGPALFSATIFGVAVALVWYSREMVNKGVLR